MGLHVKYHFFGQILIKLDFFLDRFSKNPSNIGLHVKYHFFGQILIKLDFFWTDFRKIPQILVFM